MSMYKNSTHTSDSVIVLYMSMLRIAEFSKHNFYIVFILLYMKLYNIIMIIMYYLHEKTDV